MKVEIDKSSGFCFGVVNAIKVAEDSLKDTDKLYSLGDIVHNSAEINRLKEMGLVTVSRQEYLQLKDTRVLIRAHGEPPETYEYALKNNIELIDATCTVVLKLQQRVKESYSEGEKHQGQIVILGKKGHAEVVGLNGYANNEAIIIQEEENLEEIDFSKPITIYAQTTRSIEEFRALSEKIKKLAQEGVQVVVKDTVCRQVSNRVPRLRAFVKNYGIILFVAGLKSSNGKFLYEVCKQENPNTKFVTNIDDLEGRWFTHVDSVGICGATSTPQWLMEEVAEWVRHLPPL
ncbi:4-hydroxy-3-methylbut-2-enyl diphosphate reductase [hydrothermal vent metagenome]|uniref:4-hydroxy-3-methylbut-2-enyl diphosphate reductase n=1 Tax=hydrothermal vent metagenome TaxID=652676 RepID=A0A3B0TTR2_9ZZZZ